MIIMDVSRYQGEIDWDAVKASGLVDGVILKTVSTNRKLSSRADGLYIDPTFERNYAACRARGIPVGVYYYTYATDTAAADAELALLREALAGKRFQLPIVVDVEENKLTPLTTKALTALVVRACRAIESWGMYAMVYTYTGYQNELDWAALAPFDVWLADYTGKPPRFAHPYSMHQYTSKGSVPGVTGGVDLSRTERSYPAIIARKGLDRVRG